MPLTELHLSKKALRGFEDVYAEVSFTAVTTTDKTVLSVQTQPGFLCKIVGYRQNFDADLNHYITFHLNANGIPLFPYENTKVQLGQIGQDVYLPVPIVVAGNSLVTVTATVATGPTFASTDYASARVIITYEDPEQLKREGLL